MNEEKEELKQKLEKVQSQMTLLNTQVPSERRSSDPPPGAHGQYCPPPYQLQYPPLAHPGAVYGGYDWQIRYPPAGLNAAHPHYRPSEGAWNAPYPAARSQHAAEPDWPKADSKEPTSPGLGKGQH
ncbi:TNFAIP3-interacting protein 1 isoform X2 [Scyliorhinus torazame]|uniref:TNFAIP3-interacting protein 1 isoform X2 n=1 Tax=Scyliorhinus torazame TaxID=75743 RepID=UPI003B5B1BDC